MTVAEKILPRRAALLPHAKQLRIRMTDAGQRLWQYLRAGRLQGYKFRRQQPIGDYIVDFLCLAPKLVVGADGGQHGEQQAYDQARTAYLQSLGFTVLRFWNHEILQQTESVLDAILQRLRELDGPQ